jgi:hypothetical protein
MTIMEVVAALRGAPHLVAARPKGLAIAMSDRGVLIRVAIMRPYRWAPTAHDLQAIDWAVFTREKYGEILRQAAEAEAQALETHEHERDRTT